MTASYDVVAVVVVVVLTLGIGSYGLRLARTTSDFLVASRAVSPVWNASAIGGEYLSAASFLGVAGLVLAYGADMLWYPVGFVAGYLVLLLMVAAPLRRSGAYTVPDFAEVRLRSLAVRRLACDSRVARGDRASRCALRLVGPLTGSRSTNTHPTNGTGFPPMRRPSSNSHGYVPWNSWNESLLRMRAPTLLAMLSTNASPRPMAPAGGATTSLWATAASNSVSSDFSMR